jgi:hypothetical protein
MRKSNRHVKSFQTNAFKWSCITFLQSQTTDEWFIKNTNYKFFLKYLTFQSLDFENTCCRLSIFMKRKLIEYPLTWTYFYSYSSMRVILCTRCIIHVFSQESMMIYFSSTNYKFFFKYLTFQSLDFENTCCRLSQRRIKRTKLYIYLFHTRICQHYYIICILIYSYILLL